MNRNASRRPILAFLALLMMLPGAAPPAAAAVRCDAADFVQRASDAYDHAAQTGSPVAFANAAARFSDLQALSLFALGRYRKDLPKSREAEYFTLTRNFIGRFMLKNGGGFKTSNLTIISCMSSSTGMIVTARLSNGDRVVFQIAGSGGSYRVVDLSMHGIWLAQQMRSTFVGTITNYGGSIEAMFVYVRGRQ